LTTLTERIPVADIAADASQIRLGRFLATVITALFVALGWTAGALWFGVRHCAAAVRYGWRQGARIPRAPQADGGGPA